MFVGVIGKSSVRCSRLPCLADWIIGVRRPGVNVAERMSTEFKGHVVICMNPGSDRSRRGADRVDTRPQTAERGDGLPMYRRGHLDQAFWSTSVPA